MAINTQTLRETLRLSFTTNFSNRKIAELANTSINTVKKYRQNSIEKNFDWEFLKAQDDFQLMANFQASKSSSSDKRMPCWILIHKQMQAKHQTIIELWDEYCLSNPQDAYSYSQFTYYYRKFLSKIDITMRQVHYAGECIYVDYAGYLIPWTDMNTGETFKAQIFVSVFGCSNYTFVWASKSQKIEDWIDAHNQMFLFYGGVPQVLVPDNLKSAVIKAGKNQTLNRTYLELSRHYNCAIVPARVRKPQDKSKAELGVQFASRWISAPLSRRKFFSVAEINEAIKELLPKLNERQFKKLPGCRKSRFEELDRPKLSPLPERIFEYAEWITKQKVGPDYHVYVKQHAYSVPYQLVGENVEARVTLNTVELLNSGKRVASHIRSFVQGEHTTDPTHRPPNHRAYAEQTLDKFKAWASQIGIYAELAVVAQFEGRPEYSMIGRKACSQLKSIARMYGNERFEDACIRANEINSLTVKSIRSILQCHLDQSKEDNPIQTQLPLHHNVRGSNYYQQGGL